MKKLKFLNLFKRWEEIEREILLIFLTLNQDYVMENYADRWHIIRDNHMQEDHVVGQHMIWNSNTENHVDGWYVTGIIIAKDHGNGYYVTNITAM